LSNFPIILYGADETTWRTKQSGVTPGSPPLLGVDKTNRVVNGGCFHIIVQALLPHRMGKLAQTNSFFSSAFGSHGKYFSGDLPDHLLLSAQSDSALTSCFVIAFGPYRKYDTAS